MTEEILIKRFKGEDFYTIIADSKVLKFEPKDISEVVSPRIIKELVIEHLK
jgi:hypothetical protein